MWILAPCLGTAAAGIVRGPMHRLCMGMRDATCVSALPQPFCVWWYACRRVSMILKNRPLTRSRPYPEPNVIEFLHISRSVGVAPSSAHKTRARKKIRVSEHHSALGLWAWPSLALHQTCRVSRMVSRQPQTHGFRSNS